METIYYVSGYRITSDNKRREFKRIFNNLTLAELATAKMQSVKIIPLQGQTKMDAANKLIMSFEKTV